MKKKIPFVKYTSYGNNFVIIDELESPLFSEKGKCHFANLATNTYFGIGADNFLVIQRCRREVLDSINKAHGYWAETPELSGADFIFRMFEPDGTEAFSCGNGLMCIASYLFRKYGLGAVRIVTEIPTPTPKVVKIGTDRGDGTNWAHLGHPRRIPQNMFKPLVAEPYDDIIHTVNDIDITFRAHDLEPFSNDTRINLKAYLVFTGEPHLVVFPAKDGPLDGFENVLFASSSHNLVAEKIIERRVNFGIWLVNQIGMSLNTKQLNLFPVGMNINFARPVSANESESDILEYRCFERGINKETLACGTGAVAVSYVARRLDLIHSPKNTILPYRCRLHKPNAQIHINEDESGSQIHGYPIMLFEGEFDFNE